MSPGTRRSASVSAPLLAAAALAISATGCRSKPEMQRCVDEQNRVVDDALCNTPQALQQQQQQRQPDGHGGFLPLFIPYRYYYGGGGGFGLGSSVFGGAYAAQQGHQYTTPTGRVTGSRGGFFGGSTSRGGFGSSHGGGSGSGSGGE